ncbi:MAG: hypothetical protein O3C27_14810, partial [Actinomycetota bacterium]|nr:hypothetical protein [Actinomycetota bacterium]
MAELTPTPDVEETPEPAPIVRPDSAGVPSPDRRLLGLVIAIVAAVYVFAQLRPGLLLADNTPSGGDMGAHVWGPAYLRDSLLTSGRLTGWTNDWYAGFPAYHFYMVVPALAILALNSGLNPLLGVPAAAVLLVAVVVIGRRS